MCWMICIIYIMAAYSANYDAVLDALAVGDIDQARLLLTEGGSLNLQKAAQVVISSGQCEALKFLIREYKLDVNKYCCLHLALVTGQEDIAKLLVDSGADVSKGWDVENEGDIDILWGEYLETLKTKYIDRLRVFHHYPLSLSVNCSIDMMRFLLQSGADVNRPGVNLWFVTGETALHMAVNTGNVAKVKLLIDHGANVDAKTGKYETPLIYACHNPFVNSDCVQVLLERGANPNSRTRTGSNTPIHLATKSGNTQKLHLLIQHGAQLEARTSDGKTALILACKESVPADCVKILLEDGAFPNVKNRSQQMPLALAKDTNVEEKISLLKQYGAIEEERIDQEETALMSACQRSGDVETVRHLLENNASPNLRNRRGETALHYAVLAGDTQKLQVLIQYNSDVNSMDDNGVTPLMKACKDVSVCVECVRLLLENSALPGLTDIRGETAVHYAARTGNRRKVQLLVQNGADVNAADADGRTPLMRACAKYSIDVDYVRFLLENNALVNQKDLPGSPALGYATRTKHLHKVKVLIEYNADVNAMMDDEKAELMKLCFRDDVDRDCVKFLIENSALPRVTDIRGYTCLHWAAERGDEEMIDLLVKNQANVNALTDGGKTPLMLACGNEFVDIKCVLSLLERDALLNLTDKNNKTAFDFAINTKCIHKLRLLVDYGANVDYNTNYLNAARKSNREFLEFFHELGADISIEDLSGQNAIMLAIRSPWEFRCSTAVQWLIDKGVSVNQRDNDGWTPLMAAVYCRHTEIVRLLLEAGADVHAIRTSRGYSSRNEATALSLALDNTMSNYYCAELLIRAGAVNSLPNRYNNLLHLMVIRDNCEMIGLLLTHGMAPTLRSLSDFDSDTLDPVSPLTLAVKYESFPVIRYLIDNMALCPCDVNGHLYYTDLQASLIEQNRTDILSFMDEFYSQPKSLFQLCCVTISYTVGGVPGRLDRINSLPLPESLKKQLSFKNSHIPES